MAIEVPQGLAASQVKFRGDEGRAWVAALPALATEYLDRWNLRPDGAPRHGAVALVLPVVTADGTPAVLKLQHVDEEHYGEGHALRVWGGQGAVKVLDEEGDALLLERLDYHRPLSSMPDDIQAVQIIARLLARLTAHQAPAGINRLSDVVAGMLAKVEPLAAALSDEDERRSLRDWAAIVREVAAEPGDRLLHWDLHYDNVLAGEREPWLAIDPKPLAGDPGFDLLPALWNRWDEIEAAPDPGNAVLRRFDAMVEVLGLQRDRAAAWSLGRVLQNSLWEVADGSIKLDPVMVAVAAAVGKRHA